MRVLNVLSLALLFALPGSASLYAQRVDINVTPIESGSSIFQSSAPVLPAPDLAQTPAAPTAINLPDAPEPTPEIAALETPTPRHFEFAAPLEDTSYSSSSSTNLPRLNAPGLNPFVRAVNPEKCPYEKGKDPACRVHWGQFAIEGSLYLAFQNTGNLYTGYFYRNETLTGKWWNRYVGSVEGWRWGVWQDQNPFLDDYIGHPLQGAITNAIWIQNDPKGMTVTQANDWVYWRSRLRALAFSTFFSFEWKLGPVGEASIGHNGDHYFYEKGVYTNETGVVELVTTPLGGLAWTIGEDYLDRTLIPRLQQHSRNALYLTAVSLLTPSKTTANVLRFRAPWYRDARVVKTDSFFSDPPDDVESSPDAILVGNHEGDRIPSQTTFLTSESRESSSALEPDSATAPAAAEAVVATRRPFARNVPRIGGVHEFGMIWGLSLFSSGPAGEVKYMPVAVRYSYLMHQSQNFALRYSPELTPVSMISFPSPTSYDTDNTLGIVQRTRGYGVGLSPLGLQFDMLPTHRVQPFFSSNAGGIVYLKPVLGPAAQSANQPAQGSRLLGTASFGAGVNIFRKQRQALTLGYRHEYLSGSYHGASTQANTFYVGVSRFRTRESPIDRGPVF